MIIDKLLNASMYSALNQRITKALKYLQTTDLASLQPGEYQIEGMDIYAKVAHYDTKPKEQGVWEAHHIYTDVQYVVEGEELFGYAPLETFQRGTYDKGTDFEQLQGSGDFFRFRAGMFVIARPHDGHMATISVFKPVAVKKVVVKVRV